MNSLMKKKLNQVVGHLETLRGLDDQFLMLDELDVLIVETVPEASVIAELETESYTELISLKLALYSLYGFIYNFDSPADYIEETIQQIKKVYKL